MSSGGGTCSSARAPKATSAANAPAVKAARMAIRSLTPFGAPGRPARETCARNVAKVPQERAHAPQVPVQEGVLRHERESSGHREGGALRLQSVVTFVT